MSALRSINRWMGLLVALLLLAAPAFADPIAMIARLSGQAVVQSPGSRGAKAAATLDWLTDGQTLEVAPRSQVILILVNGHRYELNGGSKLTLSANDPPKITGAVRELPALPPIPRLAPVRTESASTAGSFAVRGEAMTGLYPRTGTVALAEKVTLRYEAIPEAASYHVALKDDAGAVLVDLTTESTEVSVQNGALQAGAHYSWRVRAMRSGSAIAEGTEEFTTLSAEDSLRREEFASALGSGSLGNGHVPDTLAVLAEVDLRLGLVAEACNEFTEALKQKPDDAILLQALDAARVAQSGKTKSGGK